jgi:hypothetical protein
MGNIMIRVLGGDQTNSSPGRRCQTRVTKPHLPLPRPRDKSQTCRITVTPCRISLQTASPLVPQIASPRGVNDMGLNVGFFRYFALTKLFSGRSLPSKRLGFFNAIFINKWLVGLLSRRLAHRPPVQWLCTYLSKDPAPAQTLARRSHVQRRPKWHLV